jgi:hypothetical protein
MSQMITACRPPRGMRDTVSVTNPARLHDFPN